MDSIEGEIIYRIAKNWAMMPSEVVKMKYTPDGQILWRRTFIEIKIELEQAKKLEDM